MAEVLQLDSRSVAGFWAELDPELAEVVARMDRAEDWTLDGEPEVAERLVGLARRLVGEREAATLALAPVRDLRLFLAYIATSRFLRIVDWLDGQGGYGSALAERILNSPEEALEAAVPDATLRRVLADRLRVFTNLTYFKALFDPQRLRAIERAITRYTEKESGHA